MKRKINTIKGKRLVMGGGTNNLTKDEILVTETPNGIELKERSSDGSIKELAGSNQGSSEDNKGFQYKSNKTCWYLDHDKITAENFDIVKNLIGIIAGCCPIYSSIYLSWSGSGMESENKYYATYSLNSLISYAAKTDPSWSTIYFEEAECGIINIDGYNVKPTVMNIFAMFGETITEEELYNMCGLKKIPYEEYMAVNIDLIIGKELVNE